LATDFIPAGTLVYVQDELDIIIVPDSPLLQRPLQSAVIEKYSVLEPPDGRRVLAWDAAKYVNHCCHANIISTGYGFEIALRDIQEGEEITDEYGLFNLDWNLTLICQQPHCRGQLSPADGKTYWTQWDEQIQTVLPLVLTLPQPLWPLLDAQTEAELRHYLSSGEGYRSVCELLL
jgi:hypothetical protein